jgi:hypothetical protein
MEKLITTAFFVVTIFVFGLLSAARWTISSKTISTDEKRRLAGCPHLRLNRQSIAAFPAGFTLFYNDRFAFRNALLSTINLAQYKIFGFSTSPRVLTGRNDWLFFLDGGDAEILRGVPAITQNEIGFFVRLFEARRAWLAARNIRYVVFFPPSKCSIYSEKIPAGFAEPNKRSRQDEVLAALKANTRVEAVDIRPALLSGKKVARMYFKTDTHWNRLGAFVGYLAVINRIREWFPSIKPLTDRDLRMYDYNFGNGDLACMMGLRDLIPEVSCACCIEKQRAHFSSNPALPKLTDESHHKDPFATEVNDPALPSALCFRDSFMQMSFLYFGENFRRIRYQWEFDFPTAIIEKEKPDIVIQEITERCLARSGLFNNPPEVERMIPSQLFAVRPGDEQLAQTKIVGTN